MALLQYLHLLRRTVQADISYHAGTWARQTCANILQQTRMITDTAVVAAKTNAMSHEEIDGALKRRCRRRWIILGRGPLSQCDGCAANEEASTSVCIRHDLSLAVVRRKVPCACATASCCLLPRLFAVLLFVPLCCCVMWAACWLWAVCWRYHVWRMYPKIVEGFPYRYKGFIGVGSKEGGNTDRARKTESVFRFRFFSSTKKTTNKSRFSYIYMGKPKQKDRKKQIFVSVHHTEFHSIKINFKAKRTSPVSSVETYWANEWNKKKPCVNFLNERHEEHP